MSSIAKFVNPAAAIGSDASISYVQGLLTSAPDRHCLAVVDDGQLVGLVLRAPCFAADPALPVRSIMTEPLVIAADTEAFHACRLVAEYQATSGHDCFVVCEGDHCLGAGSLRTLLAGVSNDQADEAPSAAAAFKQKFLDMIGQELSAPIESVLAMTDRLGRQHLAADALSHVRAIRESGEALQTILGAAMDLTLAEHGLLPVMIAPSPLRGLIDSVQTGWSARAGRDGVTLLASFEGDGEIAAMVDAARLRQVFDCLIESALRNTRGGFIEVGLRAVDENGALRLEGRVRDTGAGLEPDQLARIFESRGGGSPSEPSGLALALAKRIILQLNGCIRAESNIGAGVSLIFDLLCEPAPAPAQATPHADSGSAGAAHILVVDDNATNRMVAEALCEMFDCTSECACDGVEAVEIAASRRFDVILMDIKMPRMDGMAATRAIRALPGPPGSVPIIALTANADPEDVRAYLACGMCGVVEKPIKPDRLLQAINAALASGDSRRAAAA